MSGRTEAAPLAKPQGEAGDIHAAANDNTLARIARDVRRTAFGWRHAQTVSTFVDGRREVLAAYDDLRERTRIARRCRGARRGIPGNPHPPCRAAETGRGLPRPAGRFCVPAGPARRHRPQGPRCIRGSPCPGSPAPARRHDAARAPNQARGGTGSTTIETRIAARGAGAGGRPRRSARARRYGDAGHDRDAVARSRRGRGSPRRHRPAGRSRRLPLGNCRGRAGGCAAARPGSPPQAGLVCAIRSLAAGLQRAHREGPTNRGAVILRQGIRGHDPAHPGAGGEPGYPGRDTGADDRGA